LISSLHEEQNVRLARAREVYTCDEDFCEYIKLAQVMVPRYLAMLRVDHDRDWNEDRFGPKTSLGHLKWMLEEIKTNFEQSITKKHRWMGFIHGLLVAYGFTTVDRERDMTRGILDGS